MNLHKIYFRILHFLYFILGFLIYNVSCGINLLRVLNRVRCEGKKINSPVCQCNNSHILLLFAPKLDRRTSITSLYSIVSSHRITSSNQLICSLFIKDWLFFLPNKVIRSVISNFALEGIVIMGRVS